MNAHIVTGTVAALMFTAGFGISGCSSNSDQAPSPARAAATTAALSASGRQALVHMREEEKLAHDVYVALDAQSSIFATIAQAEQRHGAAIAGLLGRYGLEDPAAGKGGGEFASPELQALHDELVARGRRSVLEALRVGAAIEELDIRDLEQAKSGAPGDVAMVYDHLQRASRNHLRAFHAQLFARGETYAPTYLDQASYEGIVGGRFEPGGPGRGACDGPCAQGAGLCAQRPCAAGTCPGGGPCAGSGRGRWR